MTHKMHRICTVWKWVLSEKMGDKVVMACLITILTFTLRDWWRNQRERGGNTFMAVNMSIVVFLVVTPCGLVGNYCLRVMYHPEDGVDMFPWNTGNYLQNQTALKLRRSQVTRTAYISWDIKKHLLNKMQGCYAHHIMALFNAYIYIIMFNNFLALLCNVKWKWTQL
jgi:hypothetical protein